MVNGKMINQLLRVLPVSSKVIGCPRGQLSISAYVKRYPKIDLALHEIERSVYNKKELPEIFDHFNVAEDFQFFTLKLNDARVWGTNGSVVTEKDLLLTDVSREFNDGSGFDHSIFYTIKQKTPKKIKGETAVIGTAGSNVYFHWMLDVLPRLGLLQKRLPLDQINHFVTEFIGLRFQNESLAVAGIGVERIIASNDNWRFHIESKSLWVPSLAGSLGQPNLYQVNYLRSLFNHWIYQGRPFRKIYVSRVKAGRRMIQNEKEILLVLKETGFDIIDCDEMCLADQVKTFSEASIIVGSHGSAFTNLAFCAAGTRVLEIFNQTHIQPCFWFISQLRSLDYHSLQGTSIAIDKNPKNDNTFITLQEFSAKLSLILSGSESC